MVLRIGALLQQLVAGQKLDKSAYQELLQAELNLVQKAQAFGIDANNVQKKLTARLELFPEVSAEVWQLCQNLGFQDQEIAIATLWHLWLPLALWLASEKEKLGRPLIQGILGGQGTGKTTLTTILHLILGRLGYSTLGVSIDDIYKTYADRKRLQQEDPRLIWRGPPGTHDVALGIELLDKLRQENITAPLFVPRFDKSQWQGAGDRTKPEQIEEANIILFEGWFVGARPVNQETFDHAPHPILTTADRDFAIASNTRLQEYLPLWEKLDRLIVLYPVDYRLSQKWRLEAEHKMIATGKTGMGDEEVNQFVEYFWKSLHPELFITPLTKNPQLVDIVIEINQDRTLGKIYQPVES
ncbi:MAG: glycerate kinase [Spirulinaceae cyanobacterium]